MIHLFKLLNRSGCPFRDRLVVRDTSRGEDKEFPEPSWSMPDISTFNFDEGKSSLFHNQLLPLVLKASSLDSFGDPPSGLH